MKIVICGAVLAEKGATSLVGKVATSLAEKGAAEHAVTARITARITTGTIDSDTGVIDSEKEATA